MAKKPAGRPDIIALLKARRAPGDEDGTVTTPELAIAIGCGYQVAKRTAAELVVAGKLVRAMVRRDAGWGIVQPVKGYRIVA